jgi:hypothetical protein
MTMSSSIVCHCYLRLLSELEEDDELRSSFSFTIVKKEKKKG